MEMNLSNIKSGMEVKNYKELCALLEIPIKTGEAKKKQMKDIESFLTFKKSGHKFIIEAVSLKPVLSLPLIHRRDHRKKKPQNIYNKYVQLILLQYLAHSTTNGLLYMGKTDLFKMLGLINNNFNSIQAKADFLEKYEFITENEVEVVKSHTYSKCTSILNSALKSLRSKRLISYFTVVIITHSDGHSSIANDNEVRIIDKIERDVITSLGCDAIWQVYERKLAGKFYKQVHEKLKLFNWDNTQRKLKIIYTQEYIIEEISKLDLELQKMQLNEEVRDYLTRYIKTKHKEFQDTIPAMAVGNMPKSIIDKQKSPENSLYVLDIDECLAHHKLITDSFNKCVFDDNTL